MKRHALPFLALLGLFLFSCDDDSNNGNKIDQLVGTWESTYIEFANCTDPGDDGLIADGNCGAVPCLVLTINANGTYAVVVNFEVPPENEVGTFTLDGSSIEICEDGGIDCQTFNFSVNSTTLTFTGTDDDGCDNELVFTKQ